MLLPLSSEPDDSPKVFLKNILGSAPFVCSIFLGALIIHNFLIPLHPIKPFVEFLPPHLNLLAGLSIFC